MSNTMKLIVRTLLIAVILVAGSWISFQVKIVASQTYQFAWLSSVVNYVAYTLAGVTLGTMVSPRFTKKNRWVYLFPIGLFLIIAIAPILYFLAPFLKIPVFAVNVLSGCTSLAWTLVGFFLALAFE